MLPVSRRTTLLKRRRKGFASVQGQLLHFQENSATDERIQNQARKCKGEVATFIAVDIFLSVKKVYQTAR